MLANEFSNNEHWTGVRKYSLLFVERNAKIAMKIFKAKAETKPHLFIFKFYEGSYICVKWFVIVWHPADCTNSLWIGLTG